MIPKHAWGLSNLTGRRRRNLLMPQVQEHGSTVTWRRLDENH